jgi:serine/threonine protein phosphatase PrpC
VLSTFAFASPSTPGSNQALDEAGVSVVRLLVSYSTASPRSASTSSSNSTSNTSQSLPSSNSIAAPTVQCTGLGVLVASWPSKNTQDQNNWVLTDGSLVSPQPGAGCDGNSHQDNLVLSRIQVFFGNQLYASQPVIAPIDVSSKAIHCFKTCSASPVLFSFASDAKLTQPFITLADKDTLQESAVGLTRNANVSSNVTLAHTNANLNGAGVADYEKQMSQFLTPSLLTLPLGTKSEVGMPLVNHAGELSGLQSSGDVIWSASDLKTFIQGNVPLNGVSNPVQKNWDEGVKAYDETQNFAKARDAFKAAAQANTQFVGASAFEKLAAAKASGASSQSGDSASPLSGVLKGLPSEIKILGLKLPFLNVVGGALILLVLLVFIIALRINRARKLRKELAEARRQANIDAPHIAQAEALQQQPTLPIQAETAGSSPANTLVTPDLHCPRCGEPVMKGANYCSNCRLLLSPSESGLHLRIPTPAPAAAQPPMKSVGSIADQPTVEMSPSLAANGKTDFDKTLPYNIQHVAGRRLGFVVGTRSDPGIKRKYKPNEDSILAASSVWNPNASPLPLGLFVVADGMGGHANGQDASRRAIQTIVDFMLPKIAKSETLQPEAFASLLAEGVQLANKAVHQNNMELRADMGTTVTSAMVVGSVAYVANVGDSRTYLYREGQGLQKVTNDHSVVASLVEAGIIKPDDIYTHPKRNQIYRSLGDKPLVEVDSFTVQLQAGDKLLLCSDGLWDMVRDPKIEDVISHAPPDPSMAAEALIQAALDGGGEDNVSVIVVSMLEAEDQTLVPGVQLLAKPDTIQIPQM